ncbi:hypothetical protein EYF80_030862 [Liparis tanakae]|uniref:Uncharacterized protein n=1 Tax=Liparis tanakae TaxID=230148 RepID=A0A4Z2GZN0_9TELE|nr:hypothetical protein EYF80_030862 [Liparis tanakae]
MTTRGQSVALMRRAAHSVKYRSKEPSRCRPLTGGSRHSYISPPRLAQLCCWQKPAARGGGAAGGREPQHRTDLCAAAEIRGAATQFLCVSERSIKNAGEPIGAFLSDEAAPDRQPIEARGVRRGDG